MSVPKSVVKFDKNGITYTSNVEAAEYTIQELTRAALRDVGKFITRKFKELYYSTFHKMSGKAGRACQYWVKTKVTPIELQVGIKGGRIEGFYSRFQETGTSKQRKYGLLERAATENLQTIREIESKYLSAINDDDAERLINEAEYEGNGDEE